MTQKKKMQYYLSDEEQEAATYFVSRLMDENINPLSVILFGSKARGDYDAESDIDLLLVLPDVDIVLRDHIRDIAADVAINFSTYLSTRVWDTGYFGEQARVNTNLFQEIQEDGIELLPFAV
jgi:predicted nucleotidyltransferase